MVKIITDSTSYISSDRRQNLPIEVVSHTINFNDESFKEEEISSEYLFSRMASTRVFPSSSLPAPGEFYARYEALLQEGHDILVITLSSDLSGTYNSASIARAMILEQYPHARIALIDPRSCGMAQGLVVIKAAEMAREGADLTELTAYAEEIVKGVQVYFAPATLEYLIRGGRLKGLPALVGNVLNIRPIIKLENGRGVVVEKVRGFRTALKRLLNIIEDVHNRQGLDTIAVHHTANPEKAAELAAVIKDRYGLEAVQTAVGPVVGLHLGPGSIGIAYCTKS